MARTPHNPPRLYLNEHLSYELAYALREQMLDVISCFDVGMENKDDDVQLEYALAEERAVVTVNHRHFVPLYMQYLNEEREHWGIVLSTDEPFKVLYRRLLKLTKNVTADDLKNQLRWLNEFK